MFPPFGGEEQSWGCWHVSIDAVSASGPVSAFCQLYAPAGYMATVRLQAYVKYQLPLRFRTLSSVYNSAQRLQRLLKPKAVSNFVSL